MRIWLWISCCLLPLAAWGQPLREGNWDPFNRRRLNELIRQVGYDNPDYDWNRPPYAVFDWDNTSIFLDVEEATITYQLSELRFGATPEQLDRAIRTGVPDQPFDQGQRIGPLAEDIMASYRWLYDHYLGLHGRESLEEIKKSPHYANFTTKLRYLYEALDASFHAPVSYPWLTYFFTGLTREQVHDLTREAVRAELAHEIGKETWTGGGCSITFRRGLRLVPEMQDLFQALRANGIEVYVCSASFVDVVEEIAGDDEFGYGVAPDHVLAMELERDSDGRIQARPREGFEQTFGPGKSRTIRRRLVAQYGHDPVLVAGDSQGDENMLVDFAGMRLGLILNLWRDQGTLIGGLCRRAAKDYGKDTALYLLQGRDDNRGVLIPGQGRIPPGGTKAEVFPTGNL